MKTFPIKRVSKKLLKKYSEIKKKKVMSKKENRNKRSSKPTKNSKNEKLKDIYIKMIEHWKLKA